MTPAPESSSKPILSVIIPCRNEAGFIERCLQSILANRITNGDFEVIVADGASTDGTVEVIQSLMRTYQNLRLISNPSGTTPSALNRMIAVAAGSFIVRFDAHSQMPAGYLQRCIDVLEETGASNVGGLFLTTIRTETVAAKAIAYVTSHWFGVGGASFRCGANAGPADTVAFGAFRREVFDQEGLFDERLLRNQDYEFNSRLRKNGRVVWLDPEIKVIYYNQATINGLLKQAFGTGKWNVLTAQIAPYAARFRHLAPGAFVLGLLVCFALALTGALSGNLLLAWLAAALLSPYFGTLLVVSALAFRRVECRVAILTPLVFFAYHATYGAGVLKGILLLIGGYRKHLNVGQPQTA